MRIVLILVFAWPSLVWAGEIVELHRHDSSSSDLAFRQEADGINVQKRTMHVNGSLHYTSVELKVLLQREVDRGVDVKDKHNVCKFDQTYDYELRGCKEKCNSGEEYYETLDACVPKELYKKIIARPLCKNITLPQPGFEANISTDLLAKLRNWIFSSGRQYSNGTNGVTVCHPFSLHFMTCRRWGLEVDEYKLVDGALRLWVPMYQHEYNIDEFYISDALKAIVCAKIVSLYENKSEYGAVFVYTVTCCISAFSLLLTICIFAVNNQWKYHTNVLLCHILSLFVFYTVLVLRNWIAAVGTHLCTAFGIILNLMFLAAFFWLNVLAYEIWTNFGKMQITPLTPRAHFLKFVWASAYAWGLPLLIGGSAVAINFLTSSSNTFNPLFARNCWLSKHNNAHILFMYAPAAVIMSANLTFYVLTVLKLRSLGRDATLVNTRIHKQLFRTYLKLMVVMGVCWTMEIISGIVGNHHWCWYLPDVINCLQGFFIFVIYFYKRSVLRAIHNIWKKYLGIICHQVNHHNEQSFSAETERSSEKDKSSISSDCSFGKNEEYLTKISSGSSSP